jgi:hypothetical protein
MAAKYGHIQIVERLLRDPRVDPSSLNNYALLKSSFVEIHYLLLKDPRVLTKNNFTFGKWKPIKEVHLLFPKIIRDNIFVFIMCWSTEKKYTLGIMPKEIILRICKYIAEKSAILWYEGKEYEESE